MLEWVWEQLELVDDENAHLLIRLFFVSAAAAILAVRFSQPLRDRFLSYGARSTSAPTNESNSRQPSMSLIQRLLDLAATVTVPHSWFFHFYLISVFLSFLSLHRLLSLDVVEWSADSAQSLLPVLLMTLQGSRRLFECLCFSKPSSSRMWVGHYMIGHAFYIVVNIALYLEAHLDLYEPAEWATITMSAKLSALYMFFLRSYQQHTVHLYLALDLKKYSVPDHPLFSERKLIAPHYSAECDIYSALAYLAAHQGRVTNLTMLCAWVFVVVNLGVTADGTKTWLLQRFPDRRQDIVERYLLFSPLWYTKR